MKKKQFKTVSGFIEIWKSKLLLTVKLTVIALCLSVFQGFSLTTFGQNAKVNLKMENVSIKQVLNSIEDQTNFFFIYNGKLIDVEKKVNINVDNQSINDALSEIFLGSNIKYEIDNRQILLSRMEGENSLSTQQQKSISGKVTDSSGAPLPGVSVVVKGTITGVITDMDGNYILSKIPENATLQFSFVGMKKQVVEIEGKSTINVTLVDETIGIDEVVATGYGVQRKLEITGSIATASADAIETTRTNNVLLALQGHVPGLYVTKDGTPGGGIRNIVIRGRNTLGQTSPLYILDGQPVGSDEINMLDQNSIESFQILKDAAAASIYGSRASNGVIIITTMGAKSKELKVELNSSASIQNFYSVPDMLNTEQRGRVLWQAAINDKMNPNASTPHYTYEWHTDAQENPVLDNMKAIEWLDKNVQGGIKAADNDWYKEVSRIGYITQNNISITNGNDVHSLLVSFGHYYNQGVVKFTDFGRYTGRVNSSLKLLKGKLTIGENFQLSTSAQTPMGSLQAGDQLNSAKVVLPIVPIYAEDGSLAGPIGPGLSNRNTPIQTAELTKDYKNKVKTAFGTIYLKYSPIKNLSFNSNFGIDYSLYQSEKINPRYKAGFLALAINNYSNELKEKNNWSWSNTLNYNFDLGEHRTNFLVGMEAISNNFSSLYGYKENFLLENIDYFTIDAGTGLANVAGSRTGNQLLSYFSKVNYSYKYKYLASFTLRYDGSSRFGANERFGFFPSISTGWRLSDENFIKNNFSFMSNFMLRYGFGRTGNQEIGDDASFAIFRPNYGTVSGRRTTGSAYDLNGTGSGTLPSGVVAVQTENPDLKWEATEENNIGVDFGFLDQKISGSIDYFSRNTSNILIMPPYLGVVGEGGPKWVNGATMNNKGWEFVVDYQNKINEFHYKVSSSVSHFKDNVTFLPASVVSAYGGNVEKTIIGHSLSSIFGYVTDGIFQNQQEVDSYVNQPGKGVGRLKYKDLNGDSKIDALDQDWLGTSIPDFEWGLNTIFSYKNFTITFFLQGVQGIAVQNLNKNQSDLLGAFAGENGTTRLLNAWTPQNPNTSIPALSNYDNNNETRLSDYQIENASYLKLRNLQLSYNLPGRIQKSLGLGQSKIYISGTNLLTIKSNGFSSPDPENYANWYPVTRDFTIGFNIVF